MMWRGLGMDHPMEAHKVDSRGIYARGASADVREGVSSFLEKRPAKFPMKVSDGMPRYLPVVAGAEVFVSFFYLPLCGEVEKCGAFFGWG